MSRLPYLTLAAMLVLELPWLLPQPFAESDILFFWYGGHLVTHGGSPYSAQAWLDGANVYTPLFSRDAALGLVTWPYPPWTAYLFAPFGLFAPEVGAWLLHLALFAASLAGIVLLASVLPWRRPLDHSLALVVLALSQPFVHGLRFGQFGGVVFLGAVLVLLGARRRAALPTVLGAPLVALKPHLVLIFASLVLALLVRARAWRAMALAAGVLALGIAVSFALQPDALAAMAATLGERSVRLTRYASTWSLATSLAGEQWLPVALSLVACVAAACWAAFALSPSPLRYWNGVAGTLVLSLAITPNVHSYDQILLAPVMCAGVLAAQGAPLRWRALQLTAVLVGGLGMPWALFWIANERWSASLIGAVPLLFAALLLLGAIVAKQRAAAGERSAMLVVATR